jgi:hypothetical protein
MTKKKREGTCTFSLKAGETTDHWIMFPPIKLEYSLSSKDYNYKLIYYEGHEVKDGPDVVYLEKKFAKFKILAIGDQPEITMVVKEK